MVTQVKLLKETTNLTNGDITDFVWELVNRVLNALVGSKVKQYRTKVLTRVNTVAFRTELAVKSQKKNV